MAMIRARNVEDITLDISCACGLLCEVCELVPWVVPARWHNALVCRDCAQSAMALKAQGFFDHQEDK